MASFLVEEFVGNGLLKSLLPKLLEQGWDDVPTLKLMNPEDMDAMNMTQKQKDVLGIRSYLHDRAMMQYADKLEETGKSLTELLNLSTVELSTMFVMKRGHIARFTNRVAICGSSLFPASNSIPARRQSMITSRTSSISKSELSSTYSISSSITMSEISSNDFRKSLRIPRPLGRNLTLEQSISDLKIKDGYVFKGMVASMPAEARASGFVQPPPVIGEIAPYSAIENISVQRITPEYKVGIERVVKSKADTMKAIEIWRDKPAVLVCIRRPGCIMCRAEAHQLYSKKPLFDALGIQLIAVLHEYIESEVKNFWPRYWGGVVLYDKGMGFFKALGGGKLLKEKFISGFFLNPRAIANFRRAKATGVKQNFKGEGEIKGGLFILGKGKSGIAYQFIERNFGDWAPLSEVVEICNQLKNGQQSKSEPII
ncbi:hypothetical protein LIER_14587 [Lithospermum erythrorhizon]|uniref:Peroxiredoxin-like 2A n=1 Tax=Lithospermum erythrorhizon TaxID=34254 RepID=A0AAV3Q0N6_LITER